MNWPDKAIMCLPEILMFQSAATIHCNSEHDQNDRRLQWLWKVALVQVMKRIQWPYRKTIRLLDIVQVPAAILQHSS